MNVWNFDDDSNGNGSGTSSSSIQSSRREIGSSFQVKNHAFFAADDDDSTGTGMVPTLNSGSRRKQTSGHRELVLEDDDDDDDDDDGNSAIATSALQSSSQSSRVDDKKSDSAKASAKSEAAAMAIPNVVHTVMRSSKGSQQPSLQQSTASPTMPSPTLSTATTTTASKKTKRVSLGVDAPLETDAFLQYLVREFLALRVGDSAVLALFDKEQQSACTLDDKVAKRRFERVTGRKAASSSSSLTTQSLLEQFVVAWDDAVHDRKCERSTSSRHASSSNESATTDAGKDAATAKTKKTSSRKTKPMLNVITAAEELDPVGSALASDDDKGEGEFNRLNHPGSTPKPQGIDASACILGDPGSTPKARVSDLRALGFDEDELRTAVPVENTSDTASSEDDVSKLSEYALRKRMAKKHTKRVWLGAAGSTPTKEYVFFRETPPSFVTESVEAAVDVREQLGLDPQFQVQAAAPHERFVELSSSDVAKYSVGQAVQGLGAQRNVSGVVAKVFGSRQCGTSGPGTIVVDTCPDSSSSTSSDSSGATLIKNASSVMPALDPADESLMDALLS